MITCLVGLPGSGKTWYATNVLKPDVLVDDPKGFSDFPKVLPADKHMVVCDPLLCFQKCRDKSLLPIMYPEHDIKYVFFENSPEKCKNNVEYRADGRYVDITARMLTKNYIIPDGVIPLKIWSPND